MLPNAPPMAPAGSVPSLDRLSKSVIRMNIEPTMKAVTIARNGTSIGPRSLRRRVTRHLP